MLVWLAVLVLCIAAVNVHANTEKLIFVSPQAIALPVTGPSLAELDLDVLSPTSSNLHTSISVSFANDTGPHGEQSWYLLANLQEHRRYEVRICWSATQPSRFSLEQYTINQVFETPALIQGLATYAEVRQALFADEKDITSELSHTEGLQSLLFLRVWAAADYYTLDEELMNDPPPVKVDIILDPYLLNVFPRSLVPTAAYVAVLAFASWFVSGYLWRWLQGSVRHTKPHND